MKCLVDWCPEEKIVGKGYCGRHYDQNRKYGRPESVWNEWRCRGDKGHIEPHGGYLYEKVVRDNRMFFTLIHRFMVEEYLGLRLIKGEYVHHLDRDKTNNAISNLELWVATPKVGASEDEILIWAKGVVDRYEGVEHKLLNMREDVVR